MARTMSRVAKSNMPNARMKRSIGISAPGAACRATVSSERFFGIALSPAESHCRVACRVGWVLVGAEAYAASKTLITASASAAMTTRRSHPANCERVRWLSVVIRAVGWRRG